MKHVPIRQSWRVTLHQCVLTLGYLLVGMHPFFCWVKPYRFAHFVVNGIKLMYRDKSINPGQHLFFAMPYHGKVCRWFLEKLVEFVKSARMTIGNCFCFLKWHNPVRLFVGPGLVGHWNGNVVILMKFFVTGCPGRFLKMMNSGEAVEEFCQNYNIPVSVSVSEEVM